MMRSFRTSFRGSLGLLMAALLLTMASAATASPAGAEHHDGLEVRYGSSATTHHDGLEVRYGDPAPTTATAPAPSIRHDGLEVRFTGVEAPTTATATAAESRGFDSLTVLLGLMLAAVLGAGVSMLPRGARHRRAGAH